MTEPPKTLQEQARDEFHELSGQKDGKMDEKLKETIVDAAIAYTLNHASNRPLTTCAEAVIRELEERGLLS